VRIWLEESGDDACVFEFPELLVNNACCNDGLTMLCVSAARLRLTATGVITRSNN